LRRTLHLTGAAEITSTAQIPTKSSRWGEIFIDQYDAASYPPPFISKRDFYGVEKPAYLAGWEKKIWDV